MKTNQVLVLVVSISTLAVLAITFLYDEPSAATPSPGADDALRPKSVEISSGTSGDPLSASSRASTGRLKASNDRTSSEPEPTPQELSETGSEEARRVAELESLLESLRGARLSASDQSKAWQRLADLGLADELIEQLKAELEAELEASPMDADLHAMLGNALVTKMRSENLTPAERRETSTAAMSSFDKSLELDSQNWTARFSRAMSNSSAPAFLGRQSAAIDDFETLLSQQKASPLNDDHAHTYFFLGNLHAAGGNSTKAAEVRGEARALFPNDPRFASGNK